MNIKMAKNARGKMKAQKMVIADLETSLEIESFEFHKLLREYHILSDYEHDFNVAMGWD